VSDSSAHYEDNQEANKEQTDKNGKEESNLTTFCEECLDKHKGSDVPGESS
jgi:hypothetical protein